MKEEPKIIAFIAHPKIGAIRVYKKKKQPDGTFISIRTKKQSILDVEKLIV